MFPFYDFVFLTRKTNKIIFNRKINSEIFKKNHRIEKKRYLSVKNFRKKRKIKIGAR